MTAENPYHHETPIHEKLKPHESLRVMSANIIDLLGQVRGGGITPFLEADWEDDNLNLRFQLQAHTRERVIGSSTTYSLRMFEGFDHDESYRYRYHTHVKDVHLCDSNGKQIRSVKQDPDTLPTLLGYLSSAPTDLTDVMNQEFINIMVANKIKDPRIGAKARRLGSRILPRFISS